MKSKIQKFIDTTTTSQQALIDEIESKKYKSLQAVILIAKVGRSTRSRHTATESTTIGSTFRTTIVSTGSTVTGSTADTIFSNSRNPSVGYNYGELT